MTTPMTLLMRVVSIRCHLGSEALEFGRGGAFGEFDDELTGAAGSTLSQVCVGGVALALPEQVEVASQ